MKSGNNIEFQELFLALEEKRDALDDIVRKIASARKDFFGGTKSDDARFRLEGLEKKARELDNEMQSLLKEVQQIAGIPEELLDAMEQKKTAPDSIDRIKRSSLSKEHMPTSDVIEEVLLKALEFIYDVVDKSWLKEQQGIPHKLQGDFLKLPLSLIRGIRVESEFPKIHRFAQAISICEDFLKEIDDLDFFAGALLVPQTASLGTRFPFLKHVEGDTSARIRNLWAGPSQEVDATIFELLVAGSCTAKGRFMEFLLETSESSPDLRVHDFPFPTVIECKRKRALSDYEIKEEKEMVGLFQNLYKTARHMGLWCVFEINIKIEAHLLSITDAVECMIRQRLASDPSQPTNYEWGTVAFRELPRQLSDLNTRLYSPAFLYRVFGWQTDIPTHDGIICKVQTPENIFVDAVEEPIAIFWNNTSSEALRKKSWSPLDLYGDATNQIPPGEVGIIYICYQEGGREEIADSRVDNFTTRMVDWEHSAGIRLPVSFLIRLYPRVLGDGQPDLIESGMRFMSKLYGNPVFFTDFPTTVFTRLDANDNL